LYENGRKSNDTPRKLRAQANLAFSVIVECDHKEMLDCGVRTGRDYAGYEEPYDDRLGDGTGWVRGRRVEILCGHRMRGYLSFFCERRLTFFGNYDPL